jgi:hypothetical protein
VSESHFSISVNVGIVVCEIRHWGLGGRMAGGGETAYLSPKQDHLDLAMSVTEKKGNPKINYDRHYRKMARARTRIGPDGNVINDDDDDESKNDAGGRVVGSGGIGGGGGSGAVGGVAGAVGRMRRYCAPPRRIDTFGFNLELRHFAMVLLFVSITAGSVGLAFFVFILMAYSYYQRRSSSSSGGVGGGGGGRKWKDGRAVGTNIKGVGDLPKPKGG